MTEQVQGKGDTQEMEGSTRLLALSKATTSEVILGFINRTFSMAHFIDRDFVK